MSAQNLFKLYRLKIRDKEGNTRWTSKVSDSLGFLKAVLKIEFDYDVLDAYEMKFQEHQMTLV